MPPSVGSEFKGITCLKGLTEIKLKAVRNSSSPQPCPSTGGGGRKRGPRVRRPLIPNGVKKRARGQPGRTYSTRNKTLETKNKKTKKTRVRPVGRTRGEQQLPGLGVRMGAWICKKSPATTAGGASTSGGCDGEGEERKGEEAGNSGAAGRTR